MVPVISVSPWQHLWRWLAIYLLTDWLYYQTFAFGCVYAFIID